MITNGFEQLAGTPCAGCVHMGWDFFYDEPCLICTMKVRNRRGHWKPASALCERMGFEFYEREDWKAEKAEAWMVRNAEREIKKNGCFFQETTVPAL